MNKDLEIIKWNTERLKGLVDEGERYAEEARNESNEAAERMAAEIEQLEKANSGLAESFGGLNNEIIYYKHEIARLKTELEKMKKCDACDDCWRSKGNPPYCSRGQRRESEEGK